MVFTLTKCLVRKEKNANTSVQWKCPACRDKLLTRLASCVPIKVKILLFFNNLLTCIAQNFCDVMIICALHFSPTNKKLPFKVSYTLIESKKSRLWCVVNEANCGWLTSLRKPEKPTEQIAESPAEINVSTTHPPRQFLDFSSFSLTFQRVFKFIIKWQMLWVFQESCKIFTCEYNESQNERFFFGQERCWVLLHVGRKKWNTGLY